jgi:hypothetical protein
MDFIQTLNRIMIRLFLMSVDVNLLKILMKFNENSSPEYKLFLQDKTYSMTDISIINSPIPVNEPTTRGGVYFSDKFAYKMNGTIKDLSVIPLLTKKMLGPNTEFGELKITTQIETDGKPTNLEIFTNLTNSVQTPNSIELSMIIVKLESA